MLELLLLAFLGSTNPAPVPSSVRYQHILAKYQLSALPVKQSKSVAPKFLNDPYLGVVAQDIGSGKILFSHKAGKPQGIASLTKMMTFLVIAETHSLDEIVTVSPEAPKIEGAKIGLYAHEKLNVKTLLEAILIPSANDAALALAIFDAGSEEEFVKKMNQKSRELGLNSAKFYNASGLDIYESKTSCETTDNICAKTEPKIYGNTLSAYDTLRLARINLANNFFRETVQKTQFSGTSIDEKFLHEKPSTNQLFGTFIRTKGIKTGYTPWAGECFVNLAEDENGQEILTVVLGSSDRFGETKKLLDWIWKNFEWK